LDVVGDKEKAYLLLPDDDPNDKTTNRKQRLLQHWYKHTLEVWDDPGYLDEWKRTCTTNRFHTYHCETGGPAVIIDSPDLHVEEYRIKGLFHRSGDLPAILTRFTHHPHLAFKCAIFER
jgi:hypothetical protein